MEETTREIIETLKPVCPPGVGIAVVFFTFEPGWISYGSNAQRADMIAMLRDLAAKLERGDA